MRYTTYELATVPIQMVHGHKDPTYIGTPNKGKIYDPWSEATNFKFYRN